MTVEEKLSIARGIITPLLRKIRAGKFEYRILSVEYLYRFIHFLDLQCNLTGVITHDEHVNKLDPR